MSVQAIGWVLAHSKTEGLDRFCLVVLANYADEHGLCWPSIGRIARDMNVTPRTAQRHLRSLEARGAVEIATQAAPDSRIPVGQRTNSYRIVRGDTSVTPPLTGQVGRGDRSGQTPLTDPSPKPSLEPSLEPTTRVSVLNGHSEAFAAFWSAYPRKEGKLAAEKAWLAAIRKVPVADLQKAVEDYAFENRVRARKYLPHPATWLNQGRWLDEKEAMF